MAKVTESRELSRMTSMLSNVVRRRLVDEANPTRIILFGSHAD